MVPLSRPAAIRVAHMVIRRFVMLLMARATGWFRSVNSVRRLRITRARSRRQKMAWPRAIASSASTGSVSSAAGRPTSAVHVSSTHVTTASASSSLPANRW
jgi:hypothetical protein